MQHRAETLSRPGGDHEGRTAALAERGIRVVSVRDVAEGAGVTHGLVHHYFGTKEQLTEEVIRSEVTFAAELLTTNPIDASLDSLEVIRRVLRLLPYREGGLRPADSKG